eukprot:1012581_1
MPEDFASSLDGMITSGIFTRSENDHIELAPSGEFHFSFLCALYWPFIDSYFVVTLSLFSLQPDITIKEEQLKQRAQWLGTTLYAESKLSFYEACSMDTLSNALNVLEHWKVVKRFWDGNDKSHGKLVQLLSPYQEEEPLHSLITHIGEFRKQPAVKPTTSRRSMIADIPILAKL